MVVYEALLIEGFVIFFVASFLASKILCDEALIRALVLGVLGGILYAAIPILNLAFFGEILLTILVVILGVLVTSSNKYLAKVLTNLCFIIFILGTKKVATDNFGDRALLMRVLTLIFSTLVVLCLSKHFYNIKRQKKFEYQVTITYNSNTYRCKAYLDSGNTLEDTSGLPVVIIDYKTFLHLTGVNFFDLASKNLCLKNSHFLEYNSVGTKSKMLVFEPNEVLVDGSPKKCLLGLSVGANFGEYSALLNVMLVN